MRNSSLVESFRLTRAMLHVVQADITLRLSDESLKGESRTQAITNLYAIRRVLASPGLIP